MDKAFLLRALETVLADCSCQDILRAGLGDAMLALPSTSPGPIPPIVQQTHHLDLGRINMGQQTMTTATNAPIAPPIAGANFRES